MIYRILFFISYIGLSFFGCAPDRDDDFKLPAPPGDPAFTVNFIVGDSNRVVITDLSTGQFQRLWNLPGGTPKTSIAASDTIFYTDAGQYIITLYVSSADGGGTASSSQSITIVKDALNSHY
jgi:PKD repeat protein